MRAKHSDCEKDCVYGIKLLCRVWAVGGGGLEVLCYWWGYGSTAVAGIHVLCDCEFLTLYIVVLLLFTFTRRGVIIELLTVHHGHLLPPLAFTLLFTGTRNNA